MNSPNEDQKIIDNFRFHIKGKTWKELLGNIKYRLDTEKRFAPSSYLINDKISYFILFSDKTSLHLSFIDRPFTSTPFWAIKLNIASYPFYCKEELLTLTEGAKVLIKYSNLKYFL